MKVKVAVGSVKGRPGTLARISIDVNGDMLLKRGQGAGRHDVLLLDCSQSMATSIEDVRKDSAEYVRKMTPADFVSVIIFSGHGCAQRIVGPTRTDEQGKRLAVAAVEKYVRLIGTTVFSEPLAMSLESAKAAMDENFVHHTILFTDGCAVPTKWSERDEKQKAIAEAGKLGAFGAYLSCLGYGVYYDDAFLRELIAANGGSGVYQHISDIEAFAEAIESIKAIVEKMTKVWIELNVVSDKGKGSRVYRTTPEITKVGDKGAVRITALYQGGVELFVELPAGAKSVKVEGIANGSKIESIADVFVPGDQANMIRIRGVEAFVNGDLATAQEMFLETGDDELADNLGGAYSTRDIREAGNAARAYFREKRFIGSGLKATGPNHNVLNAIRTLIEDKRNMITIPSGIYKRSGIAVADPRVVDGPGGSTLQVVDYVSNGSRFNFSLRALKTVHVLPEGGVGRATPAQVWRSYNMILDGNLRTPELLAQLSEDSFKELQEAGVIKKEVTWNAKKAYTLDFRGLKMTSPAWANPVNLRLVDLLKEEAELEAEQTALNKRIKEDTVQASASDGIYRESATEVEGAQKEFYNAPFCEYRLMSYKAKKYDYSVADFQDARTRVKEVRGKLITVRFMIRSIVFSMEATKSKAIRWDAGKTTQRGKYPKLEQTALFQGASLKRVTWQEEIACS